MSAIDDAVDIATTPTWTPEFEGQRPPFEPGNTASLKSGAHSRRVLDRAQKIIGDDLLERYEVLADYPELVESLSEATAMRRLLATEIFRGGMKNPDGSLKATELARYATASRLVLKHFEALGMTPQSQASVARDRAAAVSMASGVDLEALARRGGAAMAARDAALLAAETDDEMEIEK